MVPAFAENQLELDTQQSAISHRSFTIISIVDVLPPEIIDNIIDLVAIDDHLAKPFKSPNTRACSLTCRAFSRRCQRNLFHSVELNENARSEGSVPTIISFANLITAQPNIGGYVRELHYVMANPAYYEGDPDCPPAVPSVLGHINRLETLVLRPGLGAGVFDWKHNHLPSRSSLLRLMRTPTISSLSLDFIENIPPYDLFVCTGVKDLRLNCVLLRLTDIDLALPQMEWLADGIDLRKLSIGYQGAFTVEHLAKMKCPDGTARLRLDGLQYFTINDEKDSHSLGAIFGLLHRLSAIHLKFPRSRNLSVLVSHFHVFERLTRLCIHFHLYNRGPEPLTDTYIALKALAGKQDIKHLELTMQLQANNPFDCIPPNEWSGLEKVLLVPGWSSLTTLHFDIIVTGGLADVVVKELCQLPETHLSKFVASESLTFVFSVQKSVAHLA